MGGSFPMVEKMMVVPMAGKMLCLDILSMKEQRSAKTHLPVFIRTPVPAGSQSLSGLLAFASATSGCLNTLVEESAGQ